MNEKELINYLEQMKKYREKIQSDKKLSLEVLVKAGICNEKGQLEPVYK